MKAFARNVVLSLLSLLFPLVCLADPSLESELRSYDELSRSLQGRVAKLERNARSCYKNLPMGYQAMVHAKGVFGMFEAGRKSLEGNRVAVRNSFELLQQELGEKPHTEGADACAGGTALASSALAAQRASVAMARARHDALEPGLKSTQKSVSSPADRANLEFLINCGDPTALRNFQAALGEFDRLVRSHDTLSLYLKEQEAALAKGSAGLLASSRGCGALSAQR